MMENNNLPNPENPVTDQPVPQAADSPEAKLAAAVEAPPQSPKPKSKTLRYIIFAFLLLLVFGLAFGASMLAPKYWGKDKKEEPSVSLRLDNISKRGSLLIGTDATYPPMESFDENGNLVGYDIDLISRISEKLGVKAEIKNIAWDDVFTSLENGDIDLIISSVSITDERKEKYLFSEEYLNAGQVIITQKTNSSIKSTADLSGKKIAVQKETTNEAEALKYTADDLVIRYDDFMGATEALTKGDVDAIFSDLTNAKGIVAENPTLKIASDPFTSEFYGIVFRKDDTELQMRVNEILDTLRQQGTLVYLKQKWLE